MERNFLGKRAVRQVLLVAVVFMAPAGAMVSVTSASKENGDESESSSVPIPIELDLCAGAVAESENVIDEFDTAVDVNEVSRTASDLFGERFAGLQVDRDVCPATLKVLVSGLSALDETRFNKSPWSHVDPKRVALIQTTFGADKLNAARDLAAETLATARISAYEVEPRPGAGEVVVTSKELPAEVRIALRSTLAVSVQFRSPADYVGVDWLHSSRNDWPPYEGSLRVQTQTGTCTTGYAFGKDGDFQGSTAGHCGRDADDAFMGGSNVGNIIYTSFYGRGDVFPADALRFQAPDQHETRRIYVNPGAHRGVQDQVNTSAISQNDRVCFQGITSGSDNCGEMNRINVVFSSGGKTLSHAYCFDSADRGDGGDSGGPVYKVQNDGGANAFGMVSARDNAGNTCFSAIGRIENELNANLLKQGN